MARTLSQRQESTGALYDGRQRFGRAVDNVYHRTQADSVMTVQPSESRDESFRRGNPFAMGGRINHRIRFVDPSVDPNYRDERALAATRRKAARIEHMFDPEAGLADAQMLAIAEILRDMRPGAARSNANRTRNMVTDQRATTPYMSPALAKLAARFAKLAAKHGDARAKLMMRTVVRQSGLAA